MQKNKVERRSVSPLEFIEIVDSASESVFPFAVTYLDKVISEYPSGKSRVTILANYKPPDLHKNIPIEKIT